MSGTGSLGGSGIRRHHTISITPRTLNPSREAAISEEPQEISGEGEYDDYVDGDWTAPAIGPVGGDNGGKGLHRQASLPTSAYPNRGPSTYL